MGDPQETPPTSATNLPVPVEKQGAKYYDRNEKNAHVGRLLWFRVRVQGMPTVEAWRQLHPETTAADRSIQNMGSRFLKWYEETYPATFHEIAVAYNLTPDRMGELIDAAFT